MEDLGVLTTPPTAQPVEDSFSMDALGPTAQLLEDNLPVDSLDPLTILPTAPPVEDNLPVDSLDPLTILPTAPPVEENLPVDSLDPVIPQPTVEQVVPAPEAPVPTVQRRRPQHYLAITLPVFILCLFVSPATIFCSVPAVILSAAVSIHSGRQVPNQL